MRKGSWLFRFEIKANNESGKAMGLGAPKDASNHTFAAETATNWGWQKFATRDSLFKHPIIEQTDCFTIICTITSQAQPPAGHWLGLGIPQRPAANDRPTAVGWTGSEGASGGVGGGTYAGGGPKRVIPRDLVSAVGEMLDDPRELLALHVAHGSVLRHRVCDSCSSRHKVRWQTRASAQDLRHQEAAEPVRLL